MWRRCFLFSFLFFFSFAFAEERVPLQLDASEVQLHSQLPGRGASDRLAEIARDKRQAVFQLGYPGRGSGTAFLISSSPILLATNVHVTDIAYAAKPNGLLAVQNETGHVFSVDRVYPHPGVVRIGKDGKARRSTDASVGRVQTFSPDVSIVRLRPEAHVLPEPFQLATSDEVLELLGEPVGLLGFPGYNTKSFADWKSPPGATFEVGIVNRTSRFDFSGGMARERQLIQHSAHSWPGSSGSPIFDSLGRVVGVHNSGEIVEARGLKAKIKRGIRVDALWEIVFAYSKDLDPNFFRVGSNSTIRRRYYSPREPQGRGLAWAMERIRRGYSILRTSRRSDKYKQVGALASEVKRAFPDFWAGYALHGAAWDAWAEYNGKVASRSEILSAYRDSLNYYKIAIQKAPSSLPLYSRYAIVKCQVADRSGDRRTPTEVARLTYDLLKNRMTKKERQAILLAYG